MTTGVSDERLANDPQSELWGEHRARYRYAEARLRDLPTGARVLDIASGSGYGQAMLAAPGRIVLGADLDFSALHDSLGIASRLVQADGTRLPIPDNSLDAVTSFETLEHVPDPEGLVRDFARVLKPGGRLILSTPNSAFGPPELHQNPFHLREFTHVELQLLLAPLFSEVTLFGQWVKPTYRYVPFLMIERDLSPLALTWKLQARLPNGARNLLAQLVSGRPFYPSESDYQMLDRVEGAHTFVVVAQK
jgi:2-polyprenyl-3-methyl-5-hydroxy-6-metoxy-1,4-benzoquinol methylase